MDVRATIKALLLVLSLFIFSIAPAQIPGDDYKKTIEMADKYFAAGDYINAKASYQYAIKLGPEEQYPKDKLQETLGLLKVQLEMNILYTQKILLADDLFKSKDYSNALKAYQGALDILPGDQYASGQIKMIESLLRDQKQNDEQYALNIKDGDDYFTKKEYEKAVESFRKANGLKPDEAYPKQRIKEIGALINEKDKTASQYEKALLNAEDMVSHKNYEQAIEQLETAMQLQPAETFPPKRLAEVRKLKGDQDSYQAVIDNADNLYVNREFEKAKALYEDAHNIRPDDKYPTNMIEKIVIVMADAQNLNQSSFEIAIAQGDKYYSEKDYDKAMVEYTKALVFKPDEKYIKQRISDINDMVEFRKSQEDAYNQSIARADKLFSEQLYTEAREEYQRARQFKSLENYPEVKIYEIDNITNDINKKRDQFNKLIEGADKLFFSDDYENSREQYRTASQLFPDEQYPKDQIAMITQILGQRDTYTKAITHADLLLGNKDYDAALMEYRNANKAMPDQPYPAEKIKEIEKLKADQVKLGDLQAKYDLSISEADKLLSQKNYTNARMAYQLALEIKSGEKYPTEQLARIDKILSDQAALEASSKQYDETILNADQLFRSGDYENAKTAYQQASFIKPEEKYPKEKISQTDKILSDILDKENLQKQYEQSLADGDKLLASNEFSEAKSSYQKASGLKPGEQYPKDKIAEIDRILNELAAKADIQKQYYQLITNADKTYGEKIYQSARQLYQQAFALEPDEKYPKEKITEIDLILADIAAKEETTKNYDQAIANADKLFGVKNYTEAILAYNQASAIKPDEKYPKEKVAEINAIIGELAAKAEQQKQYDQIITNADNLFKSNDFANAKTAYQEASTLMPAEQYPKEKIAETDKMLADILAKETLQKQYEQAISEADKLFGEKDYVTARASYVKASGLIPEENYPKGKITETDTILTDLAAKADLQKQYNLAVANGDKLFDLKEYPDSKAAYEQASRLKPDEKYPKDKIAQLDLILSDLAAKEDARKKYFEAIANADKLLETRDYQQALNAYQQASVINPDEKYPKDKTTEINGILGELAVKAELQKQYEQSVVNADNLFNAKDYQNAKTAYKQASALMPAEQYPKDKITETDQILADILAKEELQKRYDQAITSADKLFDAKDFVNARAAYLQASGLKPEELYPKGKITETENILADMAAKAELQKQYDLAIANADKLFISKDYQNAKAAYDQASGLKPDEKYPKDKVAELDALLADITAKEEIQKEYDQAIANADQLFSAKDYENAKSVYQKAASLKPDEKYAKDKVAETDGIIADLAARAEIQKKYDLAISQADNLFNTKDYENAQKDYSIALSLKPQEAYPKEKLDALTGIFAEQAHRHEIQQKYNEAIAYGDKHFNNKDYANAKYEYQVANSIKPDEAYPTQKLTEIESILAELVKQKEIEGKYNKSIEQADMLFKDSRFEEARLSYEEALIIKPGADYPSKQIVEINKEIADREAELQKAYELAITKADNYFQQEDYEMAKISYERAIELKSDEVYPLDKLKIVNELILKKRQMVQEEYDKAVADADKFYASKIYDNAIDSYRLANELKPGEAYPMEMIRKILKLLAERSIVNINKEAVMVQDNTTKRFEFKPVPVKDRKANYIFFKARNPKQANFKVIINFGKDQIKNGGSVVKIPKNMDINDFIVRISAQYKWFSEDNNWISFYPEGGDIEVSLVQISYSD
jgi:tetratricopeptide (TPR) repeat protein